MDVDLLTQPEKERDVSVWSAFVVCGYCSWKHCDFIFLSVLA